MAATASSSTGASASRSARLASVAAATWAPSSSLGGGAHNDRGGGGRGAEDLAERHGGEHHLHRDRRDVVVRVQGGGELRRKRVQVGPARQRGGGDVGTELVLAQQGNRSIDPT